MEPAEILLWSTDHGIGLTPDYLAPNSSPPLNLALAYYIASLTLAPSSSPP